MKRDTGEKWHPNRRSDWRERERDAMERQVDEDRIEVVDDAVAEVLRRQTPAQRILTALKLNRLVRLRLEGHLRTLHPDWDAKAIQVEIARRMLLGSD